MGVVTGMRNIIRELRTLVDLRDASRSIAAAYRDLIEEFGRAHGERFYCGWTYSFAKDFKSWKRDEPRVMGLG
jgi:hypothetical protein